MELTTLPARRAGRAFAIGVLTALLLAGCRRAPAGARGEERDAASGVFAIPVRDGEAGASAASEAPDAAARREGCETAARQAVESLPAVKRAMAAAERAVRHAKSGARMGGVGPIDSDDGFSVGMGIHTDDRFEAQVWYAVNRAGELSVTVLGEDQDLSPALRKTVASACAR